MMISPCDFMNAPGAWIDDSGVQRHKQPQMIISDGLSDAIHLDLTQPGMDELAQACKALLESKFMPGVCLIQVFAGDSTYWLRRVTQTTARFGVTRMDAQDREITLSEDALCEVVSIIATTSHLRIPLNAPRSSLITYTL